MGKFKGLPLFGLNLPRRRIKRTWAFIAVENGQSRFNTTKSPETRLRDKLHAKFIADVAADLMRVGYDVRSFAARMSNDDEAVVGAQPDGAQAVAAWRSRMLDKPCSRQFDVAVRHIPTRHVVIRTQCRDAMGLLPRNDWIDEEGACASRQWILSVRKH